LGKASEAAAARALAALEPQRQPGGGKPPTFTEDMTAMLLQHRARGLTWRQINDTLTQYGIRSYTRGSTLAEIVKRNARIYGIKVKRKK
jgi:hypothetical protein